MDLVLKMIISFVWSEINLEIFSLVFPHGCVKFKGPHSVECLHSMWLDSGCLFNGTGSPFNFNGFQFETLSALALK